MEISERYVKVELKRSLHHFSKSYHLRIFIAFDLFNAFFQCVTSLTLFSVYLLVMLHPHRLLFRVLPLLLLLLLLREVQAK